MIFLTARIDFNLIRLYDLSLMNLVLYIHFLLEVKSFGLFVSLMSRGPSSGPNTYVYEPQQGEAAAPV